MLQALAFLGTLGSLTGLKGDGLGHKMQVVGLAALLGTHPGLAGRVPDHAGSSASARLEVLCKHLLRRSKHIAPSCNTSALYSDTTLAAKAAGLHFQCSLLQVEDGQGIPGPRSAIILPCGTSRKRWDRPGPALCRQ